MLLNEQTRNNMVKMAAFVKTGVPQKMEGVRQDRLQHYRRLVRNVFEDTLQKAFPITFQVLDAQQWKTLVNRFMAEHRAQTPYVWKMPFEFYQFVVTNDFASVWSRPYLDDLLYFEWIEIEVFTMPDVDVLNVRPEGDFLNEVVVMNPEYCLIELEFPVFKMPAEETLEHRGQYFLLAFRHRPSGVVKFVELNPLLAFVFQSMAENSKTGNQMITELVEQFKQMDSAYLKTILLPFFNDLFLQGAILGFK